MTDSPPDGTPSSSGHRPCHDGLGDTDSNPTHEPQLRSDEVPVQVHYPDVVAWVEEHFLPMFRRPLGGEFRWCARWFEHGEAISRLMSLWYAWESMRLQGTTGMGLWYRDHLDHQLPILLGPRGPFAQCSETEHLEPHVAHSEPVPIEHRPQPAFARVEDV